MQSTYVHKSLIAASSNGIGSISTAATPVITVNTSYLDTGRRIVFYSTADASSMDLTINGENEFLTHISETVAGSTASGIAATTTADFYRVTSITASSNANIAFTIGTSSVGGTPWRITNWYSRTPMQLGGSITFDSSSLTGRFDMTMDDPTGEHAHHLQPFVFNSTTAVGVMASTNSWGALNNDANTMVPIAGWRLTITSSSSSAGEVHGSVIEGGLG